MISSSSYLEIIISIVATLVVLSIFVQILQECYKYLTSLKTRAFKVFLMETFNLKKGDLLAAIQKEIAITGPFLKQKNKILPLEKEQLKMVMANTSTDKDNKEKAVSTVDTAFEQLMKNFNFSYQRRNLRITFLTALIVTFLFNLPIQNIYEKENTLSTNQLADLTQKVISINESLGKFGDSTRVANRDTAKIEYDSLVTKINGVVSSDIYKAQFTEFITTLKFTDFCEFILYILGCILTSILICFGAPFWNDILGALTSMKKKPA